MDKAIANALQRQKDLGRELAEIDAFLAMYKKFGGETDAEQTVRDTPGTPEPAGNVFASVKVVPPPARRGRRVSPDEIANAAVRIIKDIGKPLTRVELAAALADRDMEIRSVDPVNYVGTIMWRHGKDRVVSLDGHGYWLADQPYAAAGYEPGTPSGNFMKAASDMQAPADDIEDESEVDSDSEFAPDPDLARDAQIEREADEASAVEQSSTIDSVWSPRSPSPPRPSAPPLDDDEEQPPPAPQRWPVTR